MFTPERESYEPTIITGTPIRTSEDIRLWEPTIKENISTTPNRKHLYQRQSTPIKQWNGDNTSLTPLIEKHSLRDVNPFYQASESDIAETPGMIVTPNSSFTTYDETPLRMYTIQSKLDDEMRRMEQLQEDLLDIKEQCSFLAGNSSKAPATPLRELPSWRTRTPIEERRSFIDQNPYKIQKTIHSPLRATFTMTTTPSRSSVYREQSTTPFSHHHHNNNNNSHNNDNNNNSNNNKEKGTPVTSSSSIRPTEKSTPLAKTPHKVSNDSPRTELKTPDNTTQEFLDQISSAKLRSTEVIRTPGGSRVANKFWREIHGNQPNHSSSLRSKSPITKRPASKDAIPTPPPPPPPPPQPSSLKRSWKESEDAFWSESSPKPTNSAFNYRLFQAAQEDGVMSLEDELNSAAKKELNKPRPKPNTDMIAELKAKHREKFLDDSDSYKFA
ncbi:hypothetical protein K501DRAFT_333661 [Backusella circina FSU 941]|nr:hypothetical protein K501DRAFT_333661 [Backusella circina FSU 941]